MLHILLVEDNPGDILLIREAIRTSPIKADVLIAYDGEQGLRMLDERGVEPDLILLDLDVPKIDGFTLLERSRNKLAVPVVVFTNSRNPKDRERALVLGAQDYVSKPIKLGDFLSTVQAVLERWIGSASATA